MCQLTMVVINLISELCRSIVMSLDLLDLIRRFKSNLGGMQHQLKSNQLLRVFCRLDHMMEHAIYAVWCDFLQTEKLHLETFPEKKS